MIPYRFDEEEKVVKTWLATRTETGDIVLDYSYFRQADGRDIAELVWGKTVTCDEFDTVCLAHFPVWKDLATACGIAFSARPSVSTWTPSSARRTGINLRIPIVTLLNDMMACACHPASFTWELFMAVHSATLAGYCRRFSTESDSTEGQPSVAWTTAVKHLARDVTTFGGTHMYGLWELVIKTVPRLMPQSVHVVLTRPMNTGSTWTLDLEGVRDTVTVPFPKTVDAPDEKCLVEVPASTLAFTHAKVATTTGRLAAPSMVRVYSRCTAASMSRKGYVCTAQAATSEGSFVVGE